MHRTIEPQSSSVFSSSKFMTTGLRFLLGPVLLLVVVSASPVLRAGATSWVVTDTASLNAAITAANAETSGTHTITFDNDITLTAASTDINLQPDVTLVIEGGGFTLDGAGSYRGFGIFGVSAVDIQDLTITNGFDPFNGGGIYNEGTLSVSYSTISNSNADLSGGGVYNAGGIFIVKNSTFSGNGAADHGGGIYNNGALTVTNSTFSGNSAASAGGGLANDSGSTLHLINTILADSTAGGDCDNSGTMSTDVGNLIEANAGCGTPVSSDDPGLGPLGDNGGPTHTMAIDETSPAYNTGDSGYCPVTDQRGEPRPFNRACDIGAYEAQADMLAYTQNTDLDSDGFDNVTDNCPLVANPDQLDSDENGAGDACDIGAYEAQADVLAYTQNTDLDSDGFDNVTDNCPLVANPDQLDSDGNGAGDACDNGYDLDLDGILDSVETELMNTFAPKVILYPTEEYAPAGVEWLLQRDDAPLMSECADPSCTAEWLFSPIGDGINLLGVTTQGFFSGPLSELPPGQVLDGYNFKIDMVDDFPVKYGNTFYAPFYATVSRDRHNNRFAVSYWFFYAYNGCMYIVSFPPHENCDYIHEGDWEHVTFYVERMPDGSYNPLGGAYYYHESMAYYWWGDLWFSEPNRPHVFSAESTHASYPHGGGDYVNHDSPVPDSPFIRRDYTRYGWVWDPLNLVIADVRSDPPYPVYHMELEPGRGILNVGQRDLLWSRGYMDPGMGVPMPGMEWILFEGRWGRTGDGVGPPNLLWYEEDDPPTINPPTIWKVPDMQVDPGDPTTFDLGLVRDYYPEDTGTSYTCQVDWGDGTEDTFECSSGEHATASHTYMAPGGYYVEVTVVSPTDLWGGNVFKVTVTGEPAPLVVNSAADPGDGFCSEAECTLREAIITIAPGGTIDFDPGLSGSTIILGSQLILDKDMTINGTALASPVTISGGDSVRVFYINSGISVELQGLEIAHGHADVGGGIYNWYGGETRVTNSTISGNSATVDGGGITNLGTLMVTDSTLSGNSATVGGGGIYNSSSGTLTVTNSTFSGNSALQGGGLTGEGLLTVTNCTFSGNFADDIGSGIYNGGTLNLSNTILANSMAGGDCVNIGTMGTDVHNLIEDNIGCGSPVSSADPLLDPLQDNGGPTHTMAIDRTSPAFNTGDNGTCLASDQRGVARPNGAACDIGAYEFQIPAPVDFDFDHASDVVVFRGGAWRFFDYETATFDHGVWTGTSAGCIPAPMDYDGDGGVEPTQLCGGAWHFYHDDGSYNKGIWTGGVAGDLPVPADYDGDGTDDVVVWRAGAWRFFDFASGSFDHGVWTGSPPHWLGGTSVPVPMDYNGDGAADFTVWSGGPWHFYNDDGSYNKGIWTGGVAGDMPVPADYNGDITEEVVVWRSGAWRFFDFATAAFDHGVWTGAPPHWLGGTPLPSPLDYNGNGIVYFTVWSGGPWHFYGITGAYLKGIWTGGVAGDLPISRRLLP